MGTIILYYYIAFNEFSIYLATLIFYYCILLINVFSIYLAAVILYYCIAFNVFSI